MEKALVLVLVLVQIVLRTAATQAPILLLIFQAYSYSYSDISSPPHHTSHASDYGLELGLYDCTPSFHKSTTQTPDIHEYRGNGTDNRL